MRKTALVLILAVFLVVGISSASMAQVPGYWDIKASLDFGGQIELGGSEEDVKSGLTLVGEYKLPYTSEWTFGGGIRYQLARERDNAASTDFNFMPIYGLAQYNLQNGPYYFLGHLGYNTFDMDNVGDTSGGMYYAFGAGMDLASNMNAEVMYSVNSGEAEINGDNKDVDYSKVTVSLGYQF